MSKTFNARTNYTNCGDQKHVVFNKELIKDKLSFLISQVNAVNSVVGDEKDKSVKESMLNTLLNGMVDNIYNTLDLDSLNISSNVLSKMGTSNNDCLIRNPDHNMQNHKVQKVNKIPMKKALEYLNSFSEFNDDPIELDLHKCDSHEKITNEGSLTDGENQVKNVTLDVIAPSVAATLEEHKINPLPTAPYVPNLGDLEEAIPDVFGLKEVENETVSRYSNIDIESMVDKLPVESSSDVKPKRKYTKRKQVKTKK